MNMEHELDVLGFNNMTFILALQWFIPRRMCITMHVRLNDQNKKNKLEAEHSIECKLTPATRSPEICFCTL